MKTSTFKNNLIFLLSGIFSLFLIVLLITSISDNILLPSFHKLFLSFINLIKEVVFWKSLAKTILSLLLTISLSFIFAILLSISSIKNSYLESFVSPYLLLIKCSPLAIISVYIYLLNKNVGPYLIIFFAVFPIMYENIIRAIKEIPLQIRQELAITEVNAFKKFFYVYLPLILPYAISSLILSFSIGLKAAIMGEYLTLSKNSLGLLIYDYKTSVEFDMLIAILVFCLSFSLIIEIISKVLLKFIKTKYLY